VQLDPLLLPDDWTPDQAFAVAEFLIALHDVIWEGYGWTLRDGGSGPPPPVLPVPRQLDLPLAAPGDRSR
jgi:hypothetical protein